MILKILTMTKDRREVDIDELAFAVHENSDCVQDCIKNNRKFFIITAISMRNEIVKIKRNDRELSSTHLFTSIMKPEELK